MKRDLVWLIADLECRATLRGFLDRDRYDLSLGCGPFQWDENQDLIRDEKGKDSGVWHNAHLLLRGKKPTHQHAIVLVDTQFEDSPGAAQIEADIRANLIADGWSADDIEIIALDPELEIWIWQRNAHIATAFDFPDTDAALWNFLAAQSLKLDPKRGEHRFAPLNPEGGFPPAWPADAPKPVNPKGVVEALSYHCRSDAASVIFNTIASKVSVAGCTDPGFTRLKAALVGWFGPPKYR